MSEQLIKMKVRRGTSAQWVLANPVLLSGEIGLVTDANYAVIGNGVDDFTTLNASQENIYPSLTVVNDTLVLPVASALSAETSAREDGDTALNDLITAEAVTREEQDVILAAGLQDVIAAMGVLETNKQDALGFTPEDVANKQTDLTPSATKYPTVDAVVAGLNTKQDIPTGTPDGTKFLRDDNTWQAVPSSSGAKTYPLDITTAQVVHTGVSAETITYAFEIPAGTIGNNDIIEIKTIHRKTVGATGSHTIRIYLNTANVVGGAGATLLYTNAQGSAVTIMGEMLVKWMNSDTNIVAKPSANAAWGTTSGTAPTLGTKDRTASVWVQVTIQLVTTSDEVTQYWVEVIHNKRA